MLRLIYVGKDSTFNVKCWHFPTKYVVIGLSLIVVCMCGPFFRGVGGGGNHLLKHNPIWITAKGITVA